MANKKLGWAAGVAYTPARLNRIILMNKKICVLDIETEALEPTEGRIFCIGALDVDTEHIQVFYGEDEELMLNHFLQYFEEENFREIVGFNVHFDLRYIFAKCLKYEIPANRFFFANVVDIMKILKSVRNGYTLNKPGTLNEWARGVLGKEKIKLNSSIQDLYNQGKIRDIVAYNKEDLRLTYRLWERINNVLWAVNEKCD